jgi:hypothetical protein
LKVIQLGHEGRFSLIYINLLDFEPVAPLSDSLFSIVSLRVEYEGMGICENSPLAWTEFKDLRGRAVEPATLLDVAGDGGFPIYNPEQSKALAHIRPSVRPTLV